MMNEMLHGLLLNIGEIYTDALSSREKLVKCLLFSLGMLFLMQSIGLFVYGLISSLNHSPLFAYAVFKFGGRGYNSALAFVDHAIALCHIGVILGAAFCDLKYEKSPKTLVMFFVLEFMGCGMLKLVELIGSYSPILIIVFTFIFFVTVPIGGVLITSTVVPTLLIIPGLGGVIMSAVCGVVMPILSVLVILMSIAELFG